MPPIYHIAGPALVKVGTGTGQPPTLEDLGYSRDGVAIREEAHWADIHADAAGGEEGPPVETLFLGERSLVRVELVRWDWEVAYRVLARLRGATAGEPQPAGIALVASGPLTVRLVIDAAREVRHYPRAAVRGAVELNKGARASRLAFEFECYRDGVPSSSYYGVLYDGNST